MRYNFIQISCGHYVTWQSFVDQTAYEAEDPESGAMKNFALFDSPSEIPFDEFGIWKGHGFRVERIDED